MNINTILYTALQWTWGLPQTLIGSGLKLLHRDDPHYTYRGAHVTEWDKDAGISLGKFIFVPRKRRVSTGDFLLDHEYGHTIQSLILGPFYLLAVGIPSLAWNRLPYFARKREESGRSYYSAVFERTASELGARAMHSIKGGSAQDRKSHR